MSPPPLPGAESSRGQSEQFLLQAFRSFAEAADSLERSYGMLRGEVGRLHEELEQSNAGLARSLSENRQMRLHLDRILEGLPCGVLVARENGTISLLNPEGRRLLAPALAIPDSPAASSNFESLAAIPEEVLDLLRQAQSESGERECRLGDGHGGERWLAVRHAAVQTKAVQAKAVQTKTEDERGGDEPVSIFILRDVSDAKRLVRERDKLRRELALAEMSAILAHEIRNPLGSLELFAGLLAGAALPRECRQWVEQVQAGLRTLGATVNNVLHFHSLPAPERAPTDLGQLLDWAAGFLVPMARQARVELCLRNRLQGVRFAADRHRLEQVLLNLVLNSLRAMPGGGWVEISGHKIREGNTRGGDAREGDAREGDAREGDAREGDAQAAVISVSDTGPGIAAENGEKIFEAGFSTRSGSPGLGLAVCRKIVEQHGGSLTAATRGGAGARFTLTLPLDPQEQERGQEKNQEQDQEQEQEQEKDQETQNMPEDMRQEAAG
ncbi:MAG: ATP-binding protein [Candidatus Sulfotelmatobacter sp.]